VGAGAADVTCAVGSVNDGVTSCALLPQQGATYAGDLPFSVLATSDAATKSDGWLIYSTYTPANQVAVDPADSVNWVPGLIYNNMLTNALNGWATGTVTVTTPGSYDFAMGLWNSNGNNGNTAWPIYPRVAFTVNEAQFGDLATTSNPVYHLSNLQADPPMTAVGAGNLGWALCNDGVCANPSPGPVTSTLTLQDSTALSTLTGNTVTFTVHDPGSGSWGAAVPYDVRDCPDTAGDCSTLSNFILDEWIYIPDTTNDVNVIEFFPGISDGTNSYWPAFHCDRWQGQWGLRDNDQWAGVNGSTGSQPTGAPYDCTNLMSQLDTWHHIQMYVTLAPGTVTYQSFYVDGAPVFENLGFATPAQGYMTQNLVGNGPAVVVANSYMLDGQPGPITIYYDDINVTMW